MTTTTKLLAFHNNPSVKGLYIQRVKAHALADEIVQGQYWREGKGCAVGCTVHGNEHSRYETELGIPRQLAYLQDRIFEGLSHVEAKGFPLAFLEAIPVGADLSLVISHFLVWLLIDEQQGVIRFAKRDDTKVAIQQVASLYQRQLAGETISSKEWKKAYATAAATAADAAAYATAAAATAATAAATAADAATADAAAYAAAYAADAAAYAATADAAATAAATAADAAAYATAAATAADRKTHFFFMRNKLLELLRQAPGVETTTLV
jgi:hypothetical protein